MKNLAVAFNNKIKRDQQIINLRQQLREKIPGYLKRYCNSDHNCNLGIWYYIFSVLNVSSPTMPEEETSAVIQRIVKKYGGVKDTPNLLKLAIKEADKYKAGDDLIHNLLPSIIAERLMESLTEEIHDAFDNLTLTFYAFASSLSATDNG